VVGLRALYPSFFPTNDGVVFENELQTDGRGYGETRASCDTAGNPCVQTGAEGELWWVDTKTHTAHRLDNLNGDSYLPTFAAHNAAEDEKLNYEPTVNPVASGGYAWVVFTSRRLYGNVATRDAYESDPRNFDTSATSPSGPTPKKLWVAAIDLSAPPGTDPSHPAFYLPAQEIFAGNSRGYWVVNPCESDGSSCSTGDECCHRQKTDVRAGLGKMRDDLRLLRRSCRHSLHRQRVHDSDAALTLTALGSFDQRGRAPSV
jgi:hypothetical protein